MNTRSKGMCVENVVEETKPVACEICCEIFINSLEVKEHLEADHEREVRDVLTQEKYSEDGPGIFCDWISKILRESAEIEGLSVSKKTTKRKFKSETPYYDEMFVDKRLEDDSDSEGNEKLSTFIKREVVGKDGVFVRYQRNVQNPDAEWKVDYCLVCKERTGWKNRHVKSVHMRNPAFKCLHCDFTAFDGIWTIEKHAKSHHKDKLLESNTEKRLSTDAETKAEFLSMLQLCYGETVVGGPADRRATPEPHIVCRLCKEVVHNPQQHVAKKHVKTNPNRCPECNKIFMGTSTHVRRHMRNVHPESQKEVKTIPDSHKNEVEKLLQQCFGEDKSLWKRTGGYCRLCEAHIKQPGRRSHIYETHIKRSYECPMDYCQYASASAPAMKVHFRQRHPKNPGLKSVDIRKELETDFLRLYDQCFQ